MQGARGSAELDEVQEFTNINGSLRTQSVSNGDSALNGIVRSSRTSAASARLTSRSSGIEGTSDASSRFASLLQQLKEAHDEEIAELSGSNEPSSCVGFKVGGKVLGTRGSQRAVSKGNARRSHPHSTKSRLSGENGATSSPQVVDRASIEGLKQTTPTVQTTNLSDQPFGVLLPNATVLDEALPPTSEPAYLSPDVGLAETDEDDLELPASSGPDAQKKPTDKPVLECDLEEFDIPPELTNNALVQAALSHDQDCLVRLTADRDFLHYPLIAAWSSKKEVDHKLTHGKSRAFTLVEEKKKLLASESFFLSNDTVIGGTLSRLLTVCPHSSLRVFWDALTGVMLIYDAIVLPVLIGFRPQQDTLFKHVTELTVAIVWSLDIIASFTTGYYDQKSNALVLRLNMIAKHYLKKWFLLDIMLVSYDWALILIDVDDGSGTSGNSSNAQLGRSLRTLRFVRTVRLLRLLKVKRMCQKIHDRLPSESASIVFRIMKILGCLVFANHIVACMWYFVGSAGGQGHASWIELNEMDGQPLSYQYATSLHWALSQCTPASMEIFPARGSVTERVFTVVVILVAMVGFSSFISLLTASTSELRKISSDETHQFWMLRRFLRDWKVSDLMSRRIQRYLEYAYPQSRRRVQFKDVPLLMLLSEPMHNALMHEMLSVHLRVHAFFNICGTRTRIFSGALESVCYARGDTVFTLGHKGLKMYFLSKGECLYIHGDPDSEENYLSTRPSPGEENVDVVNQRAFISEASLWTNWLHVGDLEARTDCTVVVIKATEFQSSVALNTPFWLAVQEYAEGFVKELNRVGIEDLTDLLYHNFSPMDIIDNGCDTLMSGDSTAGFKAGGPQGSVINNGARQTQLSHMSSTSALRTFSLVPSMLKQLKRKVRRQRSASTILNIGVR